MSSIPQPIGLLMSGGSNRKMLHEFLEKLGHRVSVLNGIEELYCLEEQDLIVVEESLALRYQGSLRELKRRRNVLPVLLVARHSSPGALTCLREGFIDDVLYMPTSKPELTSRLNVLLRLSSQSRTALQKFERLFEDASWGIAILHPEEITIEASNLAFARMQGVSSAAIAGRDFRSLVKPGSVGQLERDLSRLRQRQSLIFQTDFLSSVGDRSFPVEIDATFYRDHQGVPLYIAAYVRDITERLQAENALKSKNLELEEATRQAKQASQAKSNFLANINHELRTPLHGVLAPLSLLSGTRLSQEQLGHLQLVQRSADDLFRLVGDLLDFTTLGTGDLELERVPVTLPELAESVIEGLRGQAKIKGLSLSLSLKDPPTAGLLLDPVRIRQVLQHLLSNAIKFTQAGSVEVCLDVQAKPRCLRCEVRDTGIGIDPNKQQSIFEFFTQADSSTTRRFEGVGLGLSLSDQLVRLMGGTLGMQSQLGRGSTFFFEIPTEIVPSAPSPKEDTTDLTTRPMNVLVVEDNPINQQVMRLLLTELGHRSTIASGGREAVDQFEKDCFDLILMDLQMPDLSGFDAARLMRERERASGKPRTPIVAITARALSIGKEECLRAGMDEYLTKPVSLEQLRKMLGLGLRGLGETG